MNTLIIFAIIMFIWLGVPAIVVSTSTFTNEIQKHALIKENFYTSLGLPIYDDDDDMDDCDYDEF